MTQINHHGIGWLTILRLGLINMAIGSFVVLGTATLNRVMVVELAMLATLPAGLVALFRTVQITRAKWGHHSDRGGARTPWIIGGMGVLCLGGILAAVGTGLGSTNFFAGLVVTAVGFILMGLGGGASGTCFLALLATRVSERRRAAAATIVWMMMIFGIVVTAASMGALLDPFSFARLIIVTAGMAAIAFLLMVVGVYGVERRHPPIDESLHSAPQVSLRLADALREIWEEQKTRGFAIFIFVSMLAFSAQDLILEPFAGLVFGMTPGESTSLSGVQHQGVFLGMALVGILGSGLRIGSLRLWTFCGCLASAGALGALAYGGYVGVAWPIQFNVFLLGFANGVFAVGAIGCMMGLAGEGQQGRVGSRMGLWGASQAIAFAIGGVIGAVAVDIMQSFVGRTVDAYGSVFAAEALLFLVSAHLALRLRDTQHERPDFQAAIIAGE